MSTMSLSGFLSGFSGAALLLGYASLLRACARSLWGRPSQSRLRRELLGGHARTCTKEQVVILPLLLPAVLSISLLIMLWQLLPEPVLAVGVVLVVVGIVMTAPAKAYVNSSLPKPYVLASYDLPQSLMERDEGTWRRDYPQTTAVAPIHVRGRRPVLWIVVSALAVVVAPSLMAAALGLGRDHPEGAGVLSGVLCLVWAAGVIALWRMRRGLVRGYSLTLDSQGIHDRSSNLPARFIPWPVVHDMFEGSTGVGVMIDRDTPAFRALPLRERRRLGGGRKEHDGVTILTRYLDLTDAGLSELMDREHIVNKYGPDSMLLVLKEERAAADSASSAGSAASGWPAAGGPYPPGDQDAAQPDGPPGSPAPSAAPRPGVVPPGYEYSDEPPPPPWLTEDVAPPAWGTGVYPPPPLGSETILALPPDPETLARMRSHAEAAGSGHAGAPWWAPRSGWADHYPGHYSDHYPAYGGPGGQGYVPGENLQPGEGYDDYVPGQSYHPPSQDYQPSQGYVPGRDHRPYGPHRP